MLVTGSAGVFALPNINAMRCFSQLLVGSQTYCRYWPCREVELEVAVTAVQGLFELHSAFRLCNKLAMAFSEAITVKDEPVSSNTGSPLLVSMPFTLAVVDSNPVSDAR